MVMLKAQNVSCIIRFCHQINLIKYETEMSIYIIFQGLPNPKRQECKMAHDWERDCALAYLYVP